MSMENNRDKILSPVDSGNKLVAEDNLYSNKIKEKVQLIEDRYFLPQVREALCYTGTRTPGLVLVRLPLTSQAQEEQ